MLLLLVLLTVGLNSASTAKLGVVQTEGGQVEGKSHRMGLFRSVDVFKGIPFADVPGKFEKPKPHPGWSGTLKATKYRDRLSTNLPVMVYLFGGAFLLGASNDVAILGDSLYDGKEMADRGGVIVVTVNYRVGTLGFLSTGDARLPGEQVRSDQQVISQSSGIDSGNYGLWDQHAAISWVRRNIEAFGGNPDNITIFGQSAGAASVSFQMLSPYSKGLFRRAITQCGVALSPWALQTKPMALTKKIARKVGCRRSNEDEMLTCLKMSDPVGLTMAGKIDVLLILGKGVVMDLLELAPVVDGDFIPDEPSRLFHNAAQFDYMAGVNSMDGHIFAGVDVPSINNRTATIPVKHVKGLLAGLTKEKGNAAVDSAFGVYSSHWGSFPDQAVVKKTVADIETDFLFLVPTQIALQLHANNTRSVQVCSDGGGGSGARTYSYLFNMKTRIPGFPGWVEAEHAEDLQYLFGKPFSTPLVYFPRHRDLAGYMIAYWTNFARTGDPNRGDSRVPVPWPPFTRHHQPYLTINHKINKSSVSYDLRSDYVTYWTQTYSSLPSIKREEEEDERAT
ncbi:hypothetical protein INR49_021210 [Caranx melampygus]|nr:hypothetical protein INR49_023210 [Caranx melampygus]KAG7217709.1 hypothetical protein INR49_021210 [Caranx melampygus]